MAVRLILATVIGLLAICPPAARCADAPSSRPVSVQELSLLLRSGYTGDEVLRETAGRPLLAPIDAAAEHALLDAGADASTVAALRDGRRVASATEAEDTRQRQATADEYKLGVWEADKARRAEAAHQAVQTKLAARRDEQLGQFTAALRDKLVVCKDDRLVPYDNTLLAGKKLFLLYAAGTDKVSRQWTSKLVEFYGKFAPAHPEFELVLVTTDGSAAAMENSMHQAAMPWPALPFEKLAHEPDLLALGKDGLPRLVLIDGGGVKIADNFENGKLLSPLRVLDVLTGKTGAAAPATAAR